MEYLLILVALLAVFAILRSWTRRKKRRGFQGVNREVNAEVERWFLRLEALAALLRDDDEAVEGDLEVVREAAGDSPESAALASIESEVDAIEATIHRLRDNPSTLEYDIPREERRHLQWREAHELKHGPLPADPCPAGSPEE